MKRDKRRAAGRQPMLPGDWPQRARAPQPKPPAVSGNRFPKLVNPLAGEWTLIAVNTVDQCGDDLGQVDVDVMLYSRRAFYLGAQAALHLLGHGANRWHMRAEIDRVLYQDDDKEDAE